MTFRNTPFSDSVDLFPRASTVCAYIQQYSKQNDVDRHVRFNTIVTRISQLEDTREWVIESQGVEGKIVERFDFVSIANGHYEEASIPQVPGLR
jgi:cation diffusion facilitator CzcD-associated flavoprotein CzcO